MELEDLEGNPAFAVLSVNVPWELISHAPEITYWIQISGEDSEESEKFTINVTSIPQQETIEFGGILEDTISKVPLRIDLTETFTLTTDHDNLKDVHQTIVAPQTVENYQNIIWIIMIVSLMGLVFGLRKFKGQEPIVIKRQPAYLTIERIVQGPKQLISIRNESSIAFRNCLVLSNNLGCNWSDSDVSYPRTIESGEVVIAEISLDENITNVTIKSDNTIKAIVPLESIIGPNSLRFD